MNVRRPNILYFLVGFYWFRADLNLRVYTETSPLKQAWMEYISLNARKFKDVLVGGRYTIHLIERIGGNKYFGHNGFLQTRMSFLLQK